MYDSNSALDILWEKCGKTNTNWDISWSEEYQELKAMGIRATRSYFIPPADPSCPCFQLNEGKRFHFNVIIVQNDGKETLRDWTSNTFDLTCLSTNFDGQEVNYVGVEQIMSAKAEMKQTKNNDPLTLAARCAKYTERGFNLSNYDRSVAVRIPVETKRVYISTVNHVPDRYYISLSDSSARRKQWYKWLDHPLFPPVVYCSKMSNQPFFRALRLLPGTNYLRCKREGPKPAWCSCADFQICFRCLVFNDV